MTDEKRENGDIDPESGPPEPISQDVRHTSVSARVPEAIGRGVFSTATMILQTNEVFVIDFLSTMCQPQQVAARIVMSASTFSQMVAALKANLARYEEQFGPLTPRQALPPTQETPDAAPGMGVSAEDPDAVPAGRRGDKQVSTPPPDVGDLYDQLKLPDEMLGGAFANVVMMRHTAEEFSLDFITNFYPRSVVTGRVYVSAGRVPSLLDTMSNSLEKYRRKAGGGGSASGPLNGPS